MALLDGPSPGKHLSAPGQGATDVSDGNDTEKISMTPSRPRMNDTEKFSMTPELKISRRCTFPCRVGRAATSSRLQKPV